MKDSGIEWFGKIPSDWEIITIKRKFTLFAGATPKSEIPENWDGDIVWITPADYKTIDKYVSQGKRNISELGLSSCSATLVPSKSIIFSKRAPIGSVAMNSVPLCTNQGCISSVPKNGVNAVFYYYMMSIYTEQFELYSAGTTFKEISANNFGNFKIVFPSFHEQKKIADYLDKKCEEIDSLSLDIQSQISILEDYKKSVITESVTKGLNSDVEMKDSHSGYLGRIPKHWEEKRLRFLGVCQNGISKSSEFFGDGYPFISYGDVYRNYVLPLNGSGLIKSNMNDRNIYSVKYGDVFFTRTSETIEEIGFSSTCLNTIDDATFAGFLIRFRPYSQDELLPEFAQYYFRSEIHRKFFVKEMNLVTRASLSQELLKKLPVLLPPIEEQKRISKYLKQRCAEIDFAIVEKKEQMGVLEQYKKSLIYEYVTGKSEVV